MVVFRDLVEEDFDDLVRWRNDPTVNRYLANRLKRKDEISEWHMRLRSNPLTWLKTIVYEGSRIGYGTVESIDSTNRKCELALAIGEPALWGKGVGNQVLSVMLNYAFTDLAMHRVTATVMRGNERSRRLIERAGFVPEGAWREAVYTNGQFADLLFYSMLEHEYRKP